MTKGTPTRVRHAIRSRAHATAGRGPAGRLPAGGGRAPRRVLLAVAGLSPQIVTETLYALAATAPHRLPTEVHVVTTTEGAERARLTLLGRDPGWFARLRREYRLPPIAFAANHIHVLRDGHGRALSDIRTPEENTRLADAITALVGEFTRSPESELHVSIAGGRKTMGFYAGYALSLYGREQDWLSHVLVSAPFESHPEFYYPSRRPRTIYDRDRRPLDASKAEVTLAEIPFVRLRAGVPKALLGGRASFGATVAALNRNANPPSLRLDLDARRVVAGGCTLTLPYREMAFYLWFAERQVSGQGGVCCPPEAIPSAEMAAAYLACYRRVRPDAPDGSGPVRSLRLGMDAGFFSVTKSNLDRAFDAAGAGERYRIQRQTFPGDHARAAEFSLRLEAAAIHMSSRGSFDD